MIVYDKPRPNRLSLSLSHSLSHPHPAFSFWVFFLLFSHHFSLLRHSIFLNIFSGYMAPEYILHAIISVKKDVFAFGAILLQTLSAMSRSEQRNHLFLYEWVSI